MLHIAAIQGNYKVADQLIKQVESKRMMEMFDAAGHPFFFPLCVLQGMRINEKDNFGWTPLHEACNWGHAGEILWPA